MQAVEAKLVDEMDKLGGATAVGLKQRSKSVRRPPLA
jgi:hypothetical protein